MYLEASIVMICSYFLFTSICILIRCSAIIVPLGIELQKAYAIHVKLGAICSIKDRTSVHVNFNKVWHDKL